MKYNFDDMLQAGEINKYFHDQLSRNAHYFPEDLQDEYVDVAKIMTNLNITDRNSQSAFLIILQHTPDILMDIAVQAPRSEDIARVASRVFNNLKKYPIKTMPEIFLAVAHAAKDIGISLKDSVLKKLAYPQGYEGTIAKPPYDINRWMQATRDIYLGIDKGKSKAEATADVTKTWDKMESNDYKHWLRFYEENVPNKYPKIAQQNVSFDALMSRLPVPNPYKHGDSKKEQEESVAPEAEEAPKPAEDSRQKIEMQRARIISRLNAAEKLLASLDGQMFAGPEQEFMLKLLQDLKRKVQTANKITIKSSLFEDFIYRAANQLNLQGRRIAAGFIYKIAQDSGEPPPPMDLAGLGGPGMDEPPPMEDNSDAVKETDKVLEEFFENLRTGVFSKKKPQVVNKNAGEIVVEAQAIDEPIGVAADPGPPDPRSRPVVGPPPEAPAPPPETAPAPEEPADIEVEEEPDADPSGTEGAIEQALQNVTVQDVCARLEMVASFYKKREMSRQLSYIDIEMDKLGIISFFPGLGEAMAKALEANQYISTRVEEILTRLKGSLNTPTDKLLGKEDSPPPPETEGIRNTLQSQQELEADRKEKRKQRENEKLERRTPEVAPPQNMAELATPPERIEQPAAPVPTR